MRATASQARQLSLFRGKRQRGRMPPAPKEFLLHVSVADVLRRWGSPEWRWTHFPAGEARSEQTGARLKRMGLQRGWPDFVLAHISGRFGFLELKRAGSGRMSDEQDELAVFLKRAGHRYAVVTTIDEAIAVLRSWGTVRVSIAEGSPCLIG